MKSLPHNRLNRNRTQDHGAKPAILIVDDREENLLALERLLDQAEAAVVKARNGNDALKACLNHEFALALLDVNMPEMNGYELAALMRGERKHSAVPIIFVTAADHQEEQIFKGYSAGAVDYLVKPLRPEILLNKVKVFLDIYRQKQDIIHLNAALTARAEELTAANQGLQAQSEELTSSMEELQTAEKELRAAHGKISTILEQMSDGFVSFDRDWRYTHINTAAAEVFQMAPEQLLGKTIWKMWPQAFDLPIGVNFRRSLQENIPLQFETYYPAPLDRWFECRCHPTTEGLTIFFSDITKYRQATLELQHSHDLLEEAQRLGKLGSWELDLPSGVLRWSEEVYRIFELDPARFIPSYEKFLQAIHPDDHAVVDQAYQRSLQDQKPYSIEHRLLFADGRIKWVREHCTSTFDLSGKPLRSVGMVQDITERKEAEEAIRALALKDQLTGLPNRRYFLELLQAALSASARHDDYGATLFIDMDNFKTINDTWGHESGDLMLIEVANRLLAATRTIDTVSRFGGDEFVVLLGELGSNRDEATRRAGLVAEKIRATLARPYVLNQHSQPSSPSIGVALHHGNRESMDALLQHADAAMYQAKSAGRNRVCFFTPATPPEAEAETAKPGTF